MSLSQGIFLCIFAAGGIGAVLLYVGWRGRRVGNHLHCAHCHFDLFGLPIDARACPECGQLIRYGKPKGVLTRDWRYIRIGGASTLISAAALVILIGIESQRIAWIRHLPLWVLLDQIGASAGSQTGQQHLDELRRRLSAGLLTHAQQRRAARTLLEYHADHARPWSRAVGHAIEELQAAGALNQSEWDNYLLNGVAVELHARPVTRADDPVAVVIRIRNTRFGSYAANISTSVENVRIDGRIASASLAPDVSITPSVIEMPVRIDPALSTGDHELTANAILTIVDSTTGASHLRTYPVRCGFLVSDTHPTLQPFSLAEIDYAVVRPLVTVARLPGDAVQILIQPQQRIDGRTAIAYDVLAGSNGDYLEVGGFAQPMTRVGSKPVALVHRPVPSTQRTIDVVLRPAPRRAADDLRIERWLHVKQVYSAIPIQ